MHIPRTLGLAAASALGLALLVPAAASAAPGDSVELTLMATTDTHGHVYDWDYFRDQPFPADDSLGLAEIGGAIEAVRAERGAESVVTLDNGDAIQGTPLTYYYGYGEGRQSVLDNEVVHPMAQAFNALGYDAQVIGNHEYNYGLDMLAAYEGDLQAPLLAANVLDATTGEPFHTPYTVVDRVIDGTTVRVGVLGLTTPGSRIWDSQHLEGVVEFQDMVEAAQEWVPQVAAESDVVVVLAHTGQGTVPDAGYDPAALEEDVAGNIPRLVPGIDVLVAGHSHQNAPSTVVPSAGGGQTLITQPNYWARSVSQVDLTLVEGADGELDVDWGAAAPVVTRHSVASLAESGEAPVPGVLERTIAAPSQAVLDALAEEHETTVDYVNTPVAQSTEELPATTSRYEDTAIIDFINHVQAETVETALDAGEYADVPVISQASPFSRTAVFPQGEVTIRDIAGLYIYENTLRGVLMTGAELREYLEYSARYFTQVEEGAEFDPATGTNAVTPDRPTGIPDYNYDALSGVDYTIDISKAVGDRIRGLAYADGTPVGDDDRFVLAVNNYRQSGGGGFPAVAEAEVVYDELQEIRQLLIDWASARGVIDPADFFDENWSLVTSSAVEPVEPGTPPVTPGTPGAGAPGADAGDAGADPAGAVGGSGSSGALAATGADAMLPVIGAVVLLLAGIAAFVFSRMRRSKRDAGSAPTES